MDTKKMGQPAPTGAPQKQLSQAAKHEHHTALPPFSQAAYQDLTPRHKRIYRALTENPAGLLSFDLRQRCGCMNIADEVMGMRRRGFNISCELEPFVTMDGEPSKIGRYKLDNTGRP